MTGEVLGRERELGSLYAFLDRPAEGSAGLVLEGEPGIGKSTFWLAAVGRRASEVSSCCRHGRRRRNVTSPMWCSATCSRRCSATCCPL